MKSSMGDGDSHVQAGPIRERPSKRPGPGEAGRILVVDDVICLCEGLRRRLRVSGYEVIGVQDGTQALSRIAKQPFDAVLTDLNMPHMSGEELLERLQQTHPDLPCIVMTGQATRQRVLRLSRMPNVMGFLVKPLDHDRLLGLLAQAVEKSRAVAATTPSS
jgi:DNA-binding NtrC family response regulator